MMISLIALYWKERQHDNILSRKELPLVKLQYLYAHLYTHIHTPITHIASYFDLNYDNVLPT